MGGSLSDYESFLPASAGSSAGSVPLSAPRPATSWLAGYSSQSFESFAAGRAVDSRSVRAEYPAPRRAASRAFPEAAGYSFRGLLSNEYPSNGEGSPGESEPPIRSYGGSGVYPGMYPDNGETGEDTYRPVPARPLNVICVGPSFQIGGVEQHTLSLAKFFDPKRVRLVKSLVTNRDNYHKASADGLPFPVVPCSAADLTRVADECDVLLMWGEGFNGRLSAKRPIGVYLAHGESMWTRLGLEGCSQVIDHVIAVSSRVKQRVCGGFPTTTILNGVDASRLGQTRSREAMRQELGFEPGDFVLGSVGRFTREKQMSLLIDAVARLPRPFKLLLVGYGPLRAELLDRANALIPCRYAFATADNYLGDFYRAMDAFCLVSSHEGFGLVIPEAMLCDRPVIATNVGCVPEVIRDRVSGVVVDPIPDSIAGAAHTIHKHPAWAKGLAAEGRAFADAHLHARRMARDYEDLLWRLAQGRGIK